MRTGVLERNKWQVYSSHAVQVAVGIVSADGEQIIAFASLIYPKFSAELESFIADAVPELQSANRVLVFQLQIFGLPVTATEHELFQHSHLLERVRCEAVRFGHVQDLLDAAGGLVVEPVASAVAEPREVTFGGEDGPGGCRRRGCSDH